MPRHKTGCAIARKTKKGERTLNIWYARIQYTDEVGRRKQSERKPLYNTKTAAKELAKEMLRELEGEGVASLDAATMTFDDLADFYQQHYLQEPEYVDGVKVSGLRSKYDYELRLRPLREFFGKKKLRSITHGDLERFKSARLKTPTVVGKNTRGTKSKGKPIERKRSIGTVHRELSFMRRVLNVAVGQGWILKNPFSMGKSLINPGDEKPRERILSKEEEEKLLAICTEWKAHLKPIIIMALYTGMRRGEMFSLKWADVDFENGIITIQAFNTKTMRERQVAMTDRLIEVLKPMAEIAAPDDLVFGIKTNAKTSFNKAKKEVGLSNLRFHDLRHTHATRLVTNHLPLSEVGRILGHTQSNTTYRYVNANVETAKRAAAVLNKFNK
jgi:integrase